MEEETVRYSHGVETIEIRPEEIATEVFEDDNAEEPTGEEPMLDQQPLFPGQYSSRKDGEVYIRSFTFARDVPIRIDYSAKFVDLAHGAIPGILAGLTSLNCSELTLKKVRYRNGISGNYLCAYLNIILSVIIVDHVDILFVSY